MVRDFSSHWESGDVAAEAASEYARAPSYEELWAPPRRPAPAERRARRWPAGAMAAAALIGAMGLIALREKIVRAAPAVAPIYAAAGLPVNPFGLELRDVRSRLVLDGARKILAIEGEIVNVRRESSAVPSMAFAVRGDNGLARYAWTVAAPKSRLEPGEKIAFRARLASPPPDGVDVLARFAKAEPPAPAVKSKPPQRPERAPGRQDRTR